MPTNCLKTATIIFHSGGQEKKEIYISEKIFGGWWHFKKIDSLLLHQVVATFQDVQTWHPIYKMPAPVPI